MQYLEKCQIRQKKMMILNKIFQHLAMENVHYCVIHDYDDLYSESCSDVDLCTNISSDKQLDELISKVCSGRDLDIIQKILYDSPNVYYYVISLGDSKFLRLDFLNDNFGINRYFLETGALLLHTDFYHEFNVAASEVEAIYLLIKRVVKGSMSHSDQSRLCLLNKKSPEPINRQVALYFGARGVHIFRQLLDANERVEKRILLNKLRKLLYFRRVFSKPNKWLLIFYYGSIRFIMRMLKPTGIVVCILSPDGGGKSSVSKVLSANLLGGFRKTRCLHWRPGLLPQLSALFRPTKSNNQNPITTSYNLNKHGRIMSLLRWIYYTSDFILGYYLKVLPMKIRTTAVIMDRYYYDVIIDPLRYGFNLPNWLLKVILPIIPKPDLSIYLDNSPDALHIRKQELPIEELKRQVKSWREFLHRLPNACIVTTNKHIDEVVNEVTEIILNKRAEMTRKMLKIEPEGSIYIWKSELSNSYVALPSKKNCRWLIPTNPILAKRAWDIYLPYSFFGKLSKTAFRLLLFLGFFAQNRLNPEATEVSIKLRNCIENALKRDDFALAISTGTRGPFRKTTAMIISSDATIIGYVKIGNTLPAIERIKHEASILKQLRLNEHESNIKLRVPQHFSHGELDNAYYLIQSPPPFSGKSGDCRFNEYYADLLCAIVNGKIEKKKFIESLFYRKLKDGINNYPLSFRGLLLHCLKNLENNIGNEEVTFALSHGDFTPWNILWNGNRAFLFDWESACLETPIGIDLVHFLFQTGFLLKKLKGESLMEYITDEKLYGILQNRLELNLMSRTNLSLCYLLKMAIDEDREHLLSMTAVERRNLIELLVHNGQTK